MLYQQDDDLEVTSDSGIGLGGRQPSFAQSQLQDEVEHGVREREISILTPGYGKVHTESFTGCNFKWLNKPIVVIAGSIYRDKQIDAVKLKKNRKWGAAWPKYNRWFTEINFNTNKIQNIRKQKTQRCRKFSNLVHPLGPQNRHKKCWISDRKSKNLTEVVNYKSRYRPHSRQNTKLMWSKNRRSGQATNWLQLHWISFDLLLYDYN